MNVIEALRTMRDDMEKKRIGVTYRMVIDQGISQLERALLEIDTAVDGAEDARVCAARARFQITGQKT